MGFIIVMIGFVVIPIFLEGWIEKTVRRKDGLRGEVVGAIFMLEWFCFMLGLGLRPYL